MGITDSKHCPICGSELKQEISYASSSVCYVNCEACGGFGLDEDYYEDFTDPSNIFPSKSEIASYLFYHKNEKPIPFLTDSCDAPSNRYRILNMDEIENWYPKTFSEKVDTFLLGLAKRQSFMSEPILFSTEQAYSACFVNRQPTGPMANYQDTIRSQKEYFVSYLKDAEYVKQWNNGIIIQPQGQQRIDEMQRKQTSNSKHVFVAMSFAPEMAEVRKAIKTAIIESGFIPRIMDEIEHNHQIVPEMLYEIKQAKFVVAELTGHNNGAYFEAGYALGLGKEVIQICEKSKFGTDGHFDVKQVNTIMWESTEELVVRLKNRIKVTIS